MPVVQAQISKEACDRIALPDEMLERIVYSITGAVDTERVYVFGSYARGDQRADSDLDLYVISNEDENRFDLATRIGMALLWMPMAKDIIVGSQARFEALRDDLACIEAVIAREGVLLYG